MRERYREERTTLKWPNGAARRAAARSTQGCMSPERSMQTLKSFERTTTVVHIERYMDRYSAVDSILPSQWPLNSGVS